MENVLIRRLKMEDADDISRIYSVITHNAVGTDFRKIIEEQALKHDNACFVAEIQGKVVGYMVSYILSGGFGADRSAWIPLLGVAPKFMGQGIGKKLAEEMFSFYRSAGIKYIYTSVRWDSADLLSFFKTLDFDRSSFINLRKVLD